MEPKLVSILTPCFNSTGFLSKLLNSILSQDYPAIEHILIDDGSTDDLYGFLIQEKWFNRFEERGYSLIYQYQTNQGQAVAINKGLKLYSGDYITWPDSDDFYLSTAAISRLITTMEQQSVNVVRSYPKIVDENETERSEEFEIAIPTSDSNVFYDCLLETNFWFSPICYFFKAETLKKVLADQIVESKVGQNFQLFLPIFYYGKVYTLSEQLVAYVVRSDSHSHKQRSVQNKNQRLHDILNLKYTLLDKYDMRVDRKIITLLQKKNDAAVIRNFVKANHFKQAIDYIKNRAYFPMYAIKTWLKCIF